MAATHTLEDVSNFASLIHHALLKNPDPQCPNQAAWVPWFHYTVGEIRRARSDGLPFKTLPKLALAAYYELERGDIDLGYEPSVWRITPHDSNKEAVAHYGFDVGLEVNDDGDVALLPWSALRGREWVETKDEPPPGAAEPRDVAPKKLQGAKKRKAEGPPKVEIPLQEAEPRGEVGAEASETNQRQTRSKANTALKPNISNASSSQAAGKRKSRGKAKADVPPEPHFPPFPGYPDFFPIAEAPGPTEDDPIDWRCVGCRKANVPCLFSPLQNDTCENCRAGGAGCGLRLSPSSSRGFVAAYCAYRAGVQWANPHIYPNPIPVSELWAQIGGTGDVPTWFVEWCRARVTSPDAKVVSAEHATALANLAASSLRRDDMEPVEDLGEAAYSQPGYPFDPRLGPEAESVSGDGGPKAKDHSMGADVGAYTEANAEAGADSEANANDGADADDRGSGSKGKGKGVLGRPLPLGTGSSPPAKRRRGAPAAGQGGPPPHAVASHNQPPPPPGHDFRNVPLTPIFPEDVVNEVRPLFGSAHSPTAAGVPREEFEALRRRTDRLEQQLAAMQGLEMEVASVQLRLDGLAQAMRHQAGKSMLGPSPSAPFYASMWQR
ncbi:uncharacterized protein BXZ73DRAFT_101996 [Epithele typhae]|uniref:uncharacterized protein n=1 Tax=Epithele typhae TaxID=378194 RepID=UPI00200760E9|nr:uncharacterized protein BXZ73DRAFT_101996 [Epithele typhae]KAH9929934.1 hypothetical protein BXZ73DRAFT_101996 [Epithele typhae]